MRETKFRVKGTTGDKLWVYINLPNIFDGGSVWYDGMDWKTLGQFTGLTDKNGKEIYDGDILALGGTEKDGHKGPYEHVAVEINNIGSRGYMAQYGLGRHNYHAPYWVEVIGTIYENPELLEKASL